MSKANKKNPFWKPSLSYLFSNQTCHNYIQYLKLNISSSRNVHLLVVKMTDLYFWNNWSIKNVSLIRTETGRKCVESWPQFSKLKLFSHFFFFHITHPIQWQRPSKSEGRFWGEQGQGQGGKGSLSRWAVSGAAVVSSFGRGRHSVSRRRPRDEGHCGRGGKIFDKKWDLTYPENYQRLNWNATFYIGHSGLIFVLFFVGDEISK